MSPTLEQKMMNAICNNTHASNHGDLVVEGRAKAAKVCEGIAKSELDTNTELWKARVVEEVKSALSYADERLEKEVYLGIKEANMMTNKEYLTQLKERL